MARSSGIATQALFKHAAKHARLGRYIEQGERRALQRSANAARDGKARAIRKNYNLPAGKYGVNKIKRTVKTRIIVGRKQRQLDAIERATSSAGIPLKHYGAKPHPKRGVVFSIRRGGRSVRLLQGFLVKSIGGHVFTRKGKSRLPLRKRFGPGLSTLADQGDVRQAGAERFASRIDEELRKEETRAHRRAGLK